MYCIFNERQFSNWNENGTHVRQFREDKDGERYPMLQDNSVVIEVEASDRYVAYTTSGEVIAASDVFSTVLSRIIHAQPSAYVEVLLEGKPVTLERYYELIAPTLYRVIYSESEEYGELVAMDIYEKGKASEAMLFDKLYDAVDYIKEQQQDDGYYYVAYRKGLEHDALSRLNGIDDYEMNDKERDYPHLRGMVTRIRRQQRENAGESGDNVA